jgi:membrane fusion protein
MAPVAGTIAQIDVAEGSLLPKHGALLSISADRNSVRLGDTGAAVSSQLHEQQRRIRSDLADATTLANSQMADLRSQQSTLQHQLAQLDAQLAIERAQARELGNLLERLQPLENKGYVSALDIQRQRTDANDAKQQILALQRQRSEAAQQLQSTTVQLAQLPVSTRTKINDLQRQLAQLQQALAQNEADRAVVLSAPVAGSVSALLVKPGQAVMAGQALLTFIPEHSRLQAQLLVPSRSIGFVRRGTPVALHYEAFPYQKFGIQHGTVESVSRSALSPNEVTQLLGEQPPPEPLYRVRVNLAAQDIAVYGERTPLQPGMRLDADLLLDRRRMVEWLFEPMYGMSKRFRDGR